MSTANEEFKANDASNEVSEAQNRQNPTPAPGKTIRFRLQNGEGPFHNFVGDTQELWRFIAKMTGGDSIKGADCLGSIIELKHYYVHNIEMENRNTGELITVPRTALMDSEGKVYTFVSNGIVDAIDTIRSIFGDGPYASNVKFKVISVRTRIGSTTYSIVPV
jgi:hypothetical protein